MSDIIKRVNKKHHCDKCKSDVTITIETVGVFGGNSQAPIHTFDRGRCNSYPQVAYCQVCDYKPV